jgi:hypothetical protein
MKTDPLNQVMLALGKRKRKGLVKAGFQGGGMNQMYLMKAGPTSSRQQNFFSGAVSAGAFPRLSFKWQVPWDVFLCLKASHISHNLVWNFINPLHWRTIIRARLQTKAAIQTKNKRGKKPCSSH